MLRAKREPMDLAQQAKIVDSIHDTLADFVGQRLRVRANMGRSKIIESEGTLTQVHPRLFIMETLWDRQRFEPAAFCLTMTSLYFTAIANGNSKMYNTEDMQACVEKAGLRVERIFDHLGQGHSILVCRLKD